MNAADDWSGVVRRASSGIGDLGLGDDVDDSPTFGSSIVPDYTGVSMRSDERGVMTSSFKVRRALVPLR